VEWHSLSCGVAGAPFDRTRETEGQSERRLHRFNSQRKHRHGVQPPREAAKEEGKGRQGGRETG